MIGEFFVERFVQKEDRFGIKTKELGEKWINGFGQCPQIIKEGAVNKIPYHQKGEYYNYGEPKAKMQEALDEIRAELKMIKEDISGIYDLLQK